MCFTKVTRLVISDLKLVFICTLLDSFQIRSQVTSGAKNPKLRLNWGQCQVLFPRFVKDRGEIAARTLNLVMKRQNLQHFFCTSSLIKTFSTLRNWMIFLFWRFRYWIWPWCTSRYLFGALGWIGGWSGRDLHKNAKQSDAGLVKLYW